MTELEINKIKQEICDIGKRIYDRGMVASNDGNISVKIGENEFLCTPTGVSKGFMTPEYICRVDGDGNVLEANPGFKPSSEIKMHMRVYKERPDVQAVVAQVAAALGDTGRILVRESGTEPVIRVMVEAPTREQCLRCVDRVLPVTDWADLKAAVQNLRIDLIVTRPEQAKAFTEHAELGAEVVVQ